MELDKSQQGKKQSDIFLESEGDNLFERNHDALSKNTNSVTADFIISRIGKFKPSISSILEIGCANALKLESLVVHFEAKAFGVDPSKSAINDARTRFQARSIPCEFWVGESWMIPLGDDSMDVVFLGFFLYLVPTEDLHVTFEEIDRILKPGGFLVIEDFDPGKRYSNQYSHNQAVKTFKDNYSYYFTTEFEYFLMEKMSYSHSSDTFDLNPDERLSTQIFQKPTLL